MTRRHFIHNLWRWSAGMPEVPPTPINHSEQWSPQFELRMRNRLIVGAYRYGPLNEPSKPRYDRTIGILNRLCDYRHDGNLEHLVDIANLALLEYEEGRHPKRHFKAVDDGCHVTITKVLPVELSDIHVSLTIGGDKVECTADQLQANPKDQSSEE